MAFDQYIDPITRDFVETDDGDFVETDDASTAVACELDSREGAWWGDPSAGSQNAAILESDLPTPEAILDSSKRSMRKLAAAGLISDVSVSIDDSDSARGYAQLLFRWFDRSSNRPVDFEYSPLWGKP